MLEFLILLLLLQLHLLLLGQKSLLLESFLLLLSLHLLLLGQLLLESVVLLKLTLLLHLLLLYEVHIILLLLMEVDLRDWLLGLLVSMLLEVGGWLRERWPLRLRLVLALRNEWLLVSSVEVRSLSCLSFIKLAKLCIWVPIPTC